MCENLQMTFRNNYITTVWVIMSLYFLLFLQRIARDRNDPDHWLDYGTFCLYINDFTKVKISPP